MADGLDPDEQRAATSTVLATVAEFLGGPVASEDGWAFDFAPQLESNWGAVFGGALAAGMLAVARATAPDRSPRSLHIQIARSVPSGPAFATARMRHAGRTVGTVEVDLYDDRNKLAAMALVTMVTPGSVAADQHLTAAAPSFDVTSTPVAEHFDILTAPIVETLLLENRRDGQLVALEAANVRPSVDGSAAGIGECTLPWPDLALTGPEAACLAADAIVLLPVMRSFVPPELLGPNADLTLRFTTAPATRVITTAAMMLSVQHGTATVGMEVQAGEHQLAHGLATSLMLPAR